MEWMFGEPLKDERLIDQYEQEIGYRFPASFRACVIKHNGSNIRQDCFDTQWYKGRVFNALFSFNPDRPDSIWTLGRGWDKTDEETDRVMRKYIVFADSPFGDPIAFDPKDDSVVFIDHETLEVEYVAPSFQAFLDKLYEDED